MSAAASGGELRRRKLGLISLHPIQDTMAMLILFCRALEPLHFAGLLLYIYWKRRWITTPSKWALRIYVFSLFTALSTAYQSQMISNFLHVFALSILAASLAGPSQHFKNAVYLAVGQSTAHFCWRIWISAEGGSIFDDTVRHSFWTVRLPTASQEILADLQRLSRQLIIALVVCVATAEWIGELVHYCPGDTGRRRKRFGVIKRRQPLWSRLASLRLNYRRVDPSTPLLEPTIRYVEAGSIGFSLDGAQKLEFTVDGVLWNQVALYDDLVVIHGLVCDSHLQIEAHLDGKLMASFPVSTVALAGEDSCEHATDLQVAQKTHSEELSKLKKTEKDHTRRLTHLLQEIEGLKIRKHSNVLCEDGLRSEVETLEAAVARQTTAVRQLETQYTKWQAECPEEASDPEELAQREWDLDHLAKQWAETRAHLISNANHKDAEIASLNDQIALLEREIETVRFETEAAVQKVLNRRRIDRKLKQQRWDRQKHEFTVSVDKLEAGTQDLYHRASLVQQAAGSWE